MVIVKQKTSKITIKFLKTNNPEIKIILIKNKKSNQQNKPIKDVS